MLITREIGWNAGLSKAVMIALDMVILIAVVAVAAFLLRRRIALWRIGKPEKRTDHLAKRFFSAVANGLFQKSILKDLYPGILHAVMFFGFIVLLMGTSVIFIQEYFTGPIFEWHFFEGSFYLASSFLMDLCGLLAVVAVVLLTVRRYLQKPPRLDNKPEDARALILLLLVLVTGFLVEGARFATTSPGEKWSFVGWALGAIIPESGVLHRVLWWVHLFLAVWFMLVIVSGKFIHIITSWANQFFRDIDGEKRGAIRPIPAEEFETAETFGIGKIEDLTWKQIFDSDACTRCGRCQEACPATQTNKPLSPKKLVQDIKSHWLEVGPAIVSAGRAAKDEGPHSESSPQASEKRALNGEVIAREETWACTHCRACVEQCPVFIDPLSIITGLRQNQVMVEGQMPGELQEALRSIETQGNPWGLGEHARLDWAKGLDVPLMADTPDAEVLFYVGCAGAFADRNQKVSRSFVRVLQAAGVKFAVLGEEEPCCGDTARRAGNEYLFQTMAQANIELFDRHGVKTIVTTCPHGYHTFKKEYPAFGGNYQVYHHTEFIVKLLEEGSLRIDPGRIDRSVTYHDSCFLGRYNGLYEPGRVALRKLGGRLIEMEKNRRSSFCCGAGGARMWIEEEKDQRVNIARTKQALETGAEWVVTACPYCLTMIQDGLDELAPDRSCHDLAELVEIALAKG